MPARTRRPGLIPDRLRRRAGGRAALRTLLSVERLDDLTLPSVTLFDPGAFAGPREIVFIDAAVPGYADLAEDLRAARLRVELVAPGEDGLAAISAALRAVRDLDAVHVVSHAAPGELRLGTARLDAAAAPALRDWAAALRPGGDVLLYGCGVAGTEAGRELVRRVAAATGADVAASTDPTGAAELGGDWELEYATGSVEAAVPFSPAARAAWGHLLGAPSVELVDLPGEYLEDLPPLVIDATLLVSDLDSLTLSGATVSVTSGFAAGEDELGFDATLAAALGLSWTYQDGGATLQFSGTALVAGYQLVLQTATFGNTSQDPTEGGRTITVEVSDGLLTGSDTRLIVVVGANDAPAAGADDYATDEDVAASGNVLANDTDPDGDQLAVVGYTQPNRGTVAVNPDGSFTYTPFPDWNGIDSFTYTVSDGKGGTATGTVTVSVAPVNDPPTAAPDSASTPEDTSVSIAVLGNDTDPDGDRLSVIGYTAPARGTVVLNADGSFTYTPFPNAYGPDSFTYTVGDGRGGTATATVSLTVDPVNDPPAFTLAGDPPAVAEDGGPQTVPGFAAGITPGPNEAGQTVTFLVVGNTNPGLFAAGPAIAPDGTLTYTLAANAFGAATITVVLRDDGGRSGAGQDRSAPQSFTIVVTPVNDAPTLDPVADLTVPEDPGVVTVTLTGITAGGGETQALRVTATSDNPALIPNPTVGYSSPNTTGTLTFTPTANASGSARIIVTVRDPGLNGIFGDADDLLTTRAFVVTVTPVNDPPVNSVPGPQTVLAGENLILRTGVAVADADALGTDTFRVTLSAANGRVQLVAITGLTVVAGANNSPSLTVEGTLDAINATLARVKFKPAAGYVGPASLTITSNDLGNRGGPPQTDTDTIPIDVRPNVTPVLDLDADDSSGATGSGYQGRVPTGSAAPAADPVDAAVTDPDSTTFASITVTLLNPPDGANEVLAADTAGTAITATYANGVLTLAAGEDGDTPANFLRVLRSLTYRNLAAAPTPGPRAITVVVNDGHTNSNTAVATLTVNAPPAAAADLFGTDEEAALAVARPGVLGNDLDPDGDQLSVVGYTQPAHGTVTVGPDGSFTYTPAADYAGPDSFTYTVSDGWGGTATATVSITVRPVNDPPTLDPIADRTVFEDAGPQTVSLSGITAGGGEVQPLTVTATSSNPGLIPAPAVVYAWPDAGGLLVFAPVPDASGTAVITVTVSDGLAAVSRTFTVTVLPVNDPPVAIADAATTAEDTPLAGATLLANDLDLDGDRLTAVLVSGPAHGTLTLRADGTYLYTPAPNYFGPDSFTYTAWDGSAASAPAVVTLNVSPVPDAPVGAADVYSTPKNTPLVVAAPGVLANDTDADGDPLAAVLVAGPANGSLALAPDGSFVYTPDPGFVGTDRFRYRASDGLSASGPVTVTINVLPPNGLPVAADDAYVIDEDGTLTAAGPGVLGNDLDPDGDPLTAVLVAGPANGTLTLHPDGSFTYAPNPDFAGEDQFTYKADDGRDRSATAHVRITVRPVADPPAAAPDAFTTTEDTALVVAGPGVLANDADPDGDPLSAVLVSGPAHGTLTLNPDGSFTYTPDPDYHGPDAFTYRAAAGGRTSGPVTVALTITPANDPPRATADAASTAAGAAVTIDVLANDADPDGDRLAVTAAGPAANGTVAVVGTTVVYTPRPGFAGTDTFTYTVSDGAGGTATATVTVTVTPLNTPPAAAADAYQLAAGDRLVVAGPGVLGNDSDPDGDPLTAVLVAGPAHGTLTLAGDGAFAYTPDPGFVGEDTFVYQAADGRGVSNAVTVTVVVRPAAVPPPVEPPRPEAPPAPPSDPEPTPTEVPTPEAEPPAEPPPPTNPEPPPPAPAPAPGEPLAPAPAPRGEPPSAAAEPDARHRPDFFAPPGVFTFAPDVPPVPRDDAVVGDARPEEPAPRLAGPFTLTAPTSWVVPPAAPVVDLPAPPTIRSEPATVAPPKTAPAPSESTPAPAVTPPPPTAPAERPNPAPPAAPPLPYDGGRPAAPESPALAAGLDELRSQVRGEATTVQVATDVTVAAGVIATAGYVLLSPRTVYWLLTAFLARPVVWRSFDPLEVIYAWERDRGRRPAKDDDESLESMVGG